MINGLGTIVKIVSGNMDANDEDRINKQLTNLNNNEERTNRFKNETITRFREIATHINREQEVMTEIINSNQNKKKTKHRR